MSTEAQIKANRQNSQKSTGPRTAEGKAAVSQNAVNSGFFVTSGRNSGKMEGESHYYLKKQSQFQKRES